MKNDHKSRGMIFASAWEESRFLILSLLKKFSFTSADIEDISQEALARAMEASARTDVRHPKQFLISIAKNVAREEARRRARYYEKLTEDDVTETHILDEPSQEQSLDAKQKLSLFVDAMGHLPPQCKRVFAMKHIQGASHKEIAMKLGISVSTVEKHAAAGLKACRNRILEHLNSNKSGERTEYLFLEDKKN